MRAFLLCVKMSAEHCSALKYASQMCQQERYATFAEASVDLSLCPGDKKKYKDGKKKLTSFRYLIYPDLQMFTAIPCTCVKMRM